MAKKPQVDVRKLKDEVTDFLKKSKWEKAADVLEQLVAAEPKDMQHRLKLGDTYRRMDQITKCIGSYQYAAKFFSDEGQLIKAIGAVKIILEIDPKNGDAQKQLQDMNERRFGKVTLESTGLKPKPGIGAGARATTASRPRRRRALLPRRARSPRRHRPGRSRTRSAVATSSTWTWAPRRPRR